MQIPNEISIIGLSTGTALTVVFTVFKLYLESEINKKVEPMLDELENKITERCKEHKTESKGDLKEIKDTLTLVFNRIEAINNNIFQILNGRNKD